MRLIDADALLARIGDLYDWCEKEDARKAGLGQSMIMIREQPIAYDLQKVLNELESLNPTDYGSIFSYEGHGCAREMKYDAIDIVERGMVDETK